MRLTDKMKDDERHIIQRILRGETALYEHFLNTYGQQVFILVARIVSNQEDAEELTQDVFLKAFQHLSSFKGTSSFRRGFIRLHIIRPSRVHGKRNLIPLSWMMHYLPTYPIHK